MHVPAITGSAGQIVLLKLDEPVALASQLGLNLDLPADRSTLNEALSRIVKAYSPLATGVCLSAELGYDALPQIAQNAGVVFCLERSLNELDPLSIPVLQAHWGIEYIRNNGGLAKLLLYAQPGEAEQVTKLEFVAEVADACRYEGVDIILEVRVINGNRMGDERFSQDQTKVLEYVKTLPDALLLESPRTALNCLHLSAGLSKPWLIADTPKIEYPVFKEQLRDVLAASAVGVSLGRVLLPSFEPNAFSMDAFEAFLLKEGRDRLLEISRICAENVGVAK